MINMRKRKELVSDISKGENSSTISSQIIISDRLNYRPAGPTNRTDRNRYIFLEEREILFVKRKPFFVVPIFQIRGKQICGAVCFPFPGADMPLNQCEVNVLGCIRIHQASGEWRVEMTVFRFVVCGHTHIHTHREIQSAG